MYRTLVAVLAFASIPASAVTIWQIDTFEDGTTMGWFAGGGPFGQEPPAPPANVPSGGPAGDGDAYLLITSQGGQGPGSRLAAMNAAQWSGNYLAAGVGAIRMSLRNFGDSELTIRLLFEDPIPGPPVNEAVTNTGFILPANSGWVDVYFAVHPMDLTPILGSSAAALSGTTIMRIIHAPEATLPVPVAGLLGVDNISAVPEPAAVALLGSGLLLLAGLRRYRG